jgi:type II secretory pathway component PulC
MADIDRTTSDEKLLKLIEGSAKKPAQKVGIKQKAQRKISFNFKSFPKPELNILNKGLLAICGLLTIIVFYNLVAGVKIMDAELFLPAQKVDASSSKFSIQERGGFLSREEYLAEIQKRNAFLPSGLREGVSEGISPTVSELVKDLVLVGIIWSKNPEVMIESTKEARTMLLKKGDTFSAEQIKVKEITRNSVILEINVSGGVTEYELR